MNKKQLIELFKKHNIDPAETTDKGWAKYDQLITEIDYEYKRRLDEVMSIASERLTQIETLKIATGS